MLGKETHQTPVRLVKGVFVPSTQPFFSENQLAEDSLDSGYTDPGPNSGSVPQV